jgi:hypothetical protein
MLWLNVQAVYAGPAELAIAASAVLEMLMGPTPAGQEERFRSVFPYEGMVSGHRARQTEYRKRHPNRAVLPGTPYPHGTIELLSLRVEDATAHGSPRRARVRKQRGIRGMCPTSVCQPAARGLPYSWCPFCSCRSTYVVPRGLPMADRGCTNQPEEATDGHSRAFTRFPRNAWADGACSAPMQDRSNSAAARRRAVGSGE